MSLSLLFFFFFFFFFSLIIPAISQTQPSIFENKCNDKCGDFKIPFPFFLNSSSSSSSCSASSVSDSFRLTCLNSTILFLKIGSKTYRVLEFLSDGVLVDFPGTSACRQYNDFNNGFDFSGGGGADDNNSRQYYAVSVDNVLGLYDCEDSSLCKTDCETKKVNTKMPGCDNGNGSGGGGGMEAACCYPLSDHSVWHVGDDLSTFSQFGCRGFSCWVVLPGSNYGKRGVKLEWAIPMNYSNEGACSKHAYVVNATAVASGIRCLCSDGFVGDGFVDGVGCFKSCTKDGREAYGKDCYTKRRSKELEVILAGVVAPAFIVASLIALFCILKRPVKSGAFDSDRQAHFHSTISFRKACRTRLFTYQELEEATKGFVEDGHNIITDHSTNGTVRTGVLVDGAHIAVHKVQCENEIDLIEVLSRVEVLSAVVHRNMSRILGCCIDYGYTPLVVYEYPANGTTLEKHLRDHETKSAPHIIGGSLDWYKRLKIATDTASVLAFLQCDISPPIFHQDLKSSTIFLDQDFSVKISGFGLRLSSMLNGTANDATPFYSRRSDVCDLGVVILEIITGCKHLYMPTTVSLQKIRTGRLEEVVDPLLYYHEQPPFRREQIEVVADLATRCLLFGGDDGKFGMVDVARELVNIMRDSVDGSSRRGPALDETFSNSSLLQMISMSPDSIHVP